MKDEIELHQREGQDFFEGWYFKVTDSKVSIAIIVGISQTKNKSCAFIQTLDTYTNQSQMIEYDINDFKWGRTPFYLKIKNNEFTQDKLILNLNEGNVVIKGTLKNMCFTKLASSLYAPTIMGPFFYLNNMECNHGIISLRHNVIGELKINLQMFKIKGIGYFEKDWGYSFPRWYLWLQSNNCLEKEANLFLSLANIPLKSLHFNGIIMNLLVGDKQLTVASYYGARVVKKIIKNNCYYIIIKQHSYTYCFKIKSGNQMSLKSPQFGKMNQEVKESLNALTTLLIYHQGEQIQKLNFINCGFEVSGDIL